MNCVMRLGTVKFVMCAYIVCYSKELPWLQQHSIIFVWQMYTFIRLFNHKGIWASKRGFYMTFLGSYSNMDVLSVSFA